VHLPLRIGLAFGTALTRDGDYYGTVVNLAARATAAAGAGRTLVDQALREAVAEHTDVSLTDAGMFTLRGFEYPVRLYQLDEQGSEQPPERSRSS